MRKAIAACAAIIFLAAAVLVYRFATGFDTGNTAGVDAGSSPGNSTGLMPTDSARVSNSQNFSANPTSTQSDPAEVASGGPKYAAGKLAQSGSPNNLRQPGPAHLEFTNIPPEAAVEAIKHVMNSYASMFGGNPVGNNEEITAALNGNNPKQSQFINAEAGMRINGKGEMIDPWGTPYFFHQISGHEMEIHSAGPDKVMWTKDDLVSR